MDSVIEPILVGYGKRHGIELEEIPEAFHPIAGKNQIRGKEFLSTQSKWHKTHLMNRSAQNLLRRRKLQQRSRPCIRAPRYQRRERCNCDCQT